MKTIHAVASLVIIGPASSIATCGLERVEGHVYGTSHYSEPKASSVDDCCTKCAADSKCQAYTWAKDTTTCYLKDNMEDSGKKDQRISGRIPVTCTTQPGVEMLGNDVKTAAAVEDEAACCTSCASNSRCAFWTYEGGKNGLCHHKNANAPDYSRQNATCTSGYVGSSPPAPPPPSHVSANVAGKIHESGQNFLCWNIDATENRGFFWRNISAEGAYGAQLARQAAALGKAQNAGYSLLRFGGSGNDYLTYAFGGTQCPPTSAFKQCLNETQLRDLLSFTEAANAKMIFGLSQNTRGDLLRNDREAGSLLDPFPFPWDSSNARAMLQFIIDEGFDHLVFGLELGNEQNSKYTASEEAEIFAVLHNLTLDLWPDASKRPVLIGPDRHSFHDGNIDSYIADFVVECQKKGVPLWGATHHEYIEVDESSFTSPSKIDLNRQVAEAIQKSIRAKSDDVKIIGGEIGPHNGGSPPCDHTSMRWANFGDSLWYADALSVKAKNGYEAFCRQDYIGADYGLVDCSTGVPLPDYWTGLLWASTMGPVVLDTTPAPDADASVRVYGHCTAAAEAAPSGAVTLLVINLGDYPTSVEVPSSLGPISRKYVLSPSQDPASSIIDETGLLGTGIELNGKVLELDSSGAVPDLAGASVGAASVSVPATSIAFLILDKADHADCGASMEMIV